MRWTLSGRSSGLGSQPYMLVFSSGFFIGGSHVCIVSVFLNIPAGFPPLMKKNKNYKMYDV
jgi:hypothetical protein